MQKSQNLAGFTSWVQKYIALNQAIEINLTQHSIFSHQSFLTNYFHCL